MQRFMPVLLIVALTFGLAAGVYAASEKFETKAGATIYVCGCGAGCSCGTISNAEGTCGCGNKLVKTTVTKVEGGKAFYVVDGKEISASLTGAYHCGCKQCTCKTISQKPGTCGCGKKLIKSETD